MPFFRATRFQIGFFIAAGLMFFFNPLQVSANSLITTMYSTSGSEYFPIPSMAACIGPSCLSRSTDEEKYLINRLNSSIKRCNGSIRAHNDIDGDCNSDLLWFYQNPQTQVTQFAYWRMSGATRIGSAIFSLPKTYLPGTTGDFNGDGLTDVIWMDLYGSVYMWLNQGSTFTSTQVGAAGSVPSGWNLVGAGDINGDGNDDLVWMNPSACEIGFWYMRGASRIGSRTISVTCGYHVVSVVDRPENGIADLIWSGNNIADYDQNIYVWTNNGQGQFTSTFAGELFQQYSISATGSTSNGPAIILSCTNYGYSCENCMGNECGITNFPSLKNALALWSPLTSAGQLSAQSIAYYDFSYRIAGTGNFWNASANSEIDAVWTGSYSADASCNQEAPACPYNAYLWRIPFLPNNSLGTYSLGVIPAYWQIIP